MRLQLIALHFRMFLYVMFKQLRIMLEISKTTIVPLSAVHHSRWICLFFVDISSCHRSVCSRNHPSIYLSVRQSIHPSIHPVLSYLSVPSFCIYLRLSIYSNLSIYFNLSFYLRPIKKLQSNFTVIYYIELVRFRFRAVISFTEIL